MPTDYVRAGTAKHRRRSRLRAAGSDPDDDSPGDTRDSEQPGGNDACSSAEDLHSACTGGSAQDLRDNLPRRGRAQDHRASGDPDDFRSDCDHLE